MIDDGAFRQLLGSNIRAARAKRRLTRAFLAKTLGLSVHFVDRLEKGQLDPDILMVYKIAGVLQVTAPELFEIKNDAADITLQEAPPTSRGRRTDKTQMPGKNIDDAKL